MLAFATQHLQNWQQPQVLDCLQSVTADGIYIPSGYDADDRKNITHKRPAARTWFRQQAFKRDSKLESEIREAITYGMSLWVDMHLPIP